MAVKTIPLLTLAELNYELEFFVRDVLTDLRHYCAYKRIDFNAEDRAAERHFASECDLEEGIT